LRAAYKNKGLGKTEKTDKQNNDKTHTMQLLA